MTNQEISIYLKEITEASFTKAMQEIDENDFSKRRRIKYYKAVSIKTGKSYPPPLLIEKAYTNSVNKNLPEGFFSGIGKGSIHFKFLEGNGFNVLENDSIKQSMTNKEKYDILNNLTREAVIESMSDLDSKDSYGVGNNYYYEVLNPNSESRYPIKEVVMNALLKLKIDFSEELFARPGVNDPVYKTLEKLGFEYLIKESKNYFIKLSKKQDLRNEIYIPKKYIGNGNKFFKDPRTEDPNPIFDTPHVHMIQMKWKGYDIDYRGYELKNFRREFDANNDTRIAGTPKKGLNSIMLFLKKDNEKYEVEIVEKDSEQYDHLFKLLDGESYMIIDDMEKINKNGKNSSRISYPLNQILYGPPGTGKTYSTITKALDIIGIEYSDYKEAQELFQNELGKRIEFVTMHQSFSYEDFVQGLKPDKTEDGKGILFDYRNGVFKNICERAVEESLLNDIRVSDTNLIDKLLPSFMLSFEEELVYDVLEEKVFNGAKIPQYVAIDYFNKKIGKKYCKAWRDKFDFILDESPRVGYQSDKFRPDEMEEFIEYSNKFKLLSLDERKNKLLVEWIESKPKVIEKTNDTRNYVIILDEINRANISRVFGELIALIEEDKRDGKLAATLPSGESFTVPSNLHIIGTMNTADKSIALVDIALRRRFKFVPMYPDMKVLKEVLEEKDKSEDEIELRVHILDSLNRVIRSKKSVDFEIGHSYFMSDDSLVDIMNDQVLPLLNEYFMYDLRVVKELLEKQQYDRDKNKIPRMGITFDKDEFKNRGLLKVNSIDTNIIRDGTDQNQEENSSKEDQ